MLYKGNEALKEVIFKKLRNINRTKLNILMIIYMVTFFLFTPNILILSDTLFRFLLFLFLIMGLISLLSYMVQVPQDMNILPLKLIIFFSFLTFFIMSIAITIVPL